MRLDSTATGVLSVSKELWCIAVLALTVRAMSINMQVTVCYLCRNLPPLALAWTNYRRAANLHLATHK